MRDAEAHISPGSHLATGWTGTPCCPVGRPLEYDECVHPACWSSYEKLRGCRGMDAHPTAPQHVVVRCRHILASHHLGRYLHSIDGQKCCAPSAAKALGPLRAVSLSHAASLGLPGLPRLPRLPMRWPAADTQTDMFASRGTWSAGATVDLSHLPSEGPPFENPLLFFLPCCPVLSSPVQTAILYFCLRFSSK